MNFNPSSESFSNEISNLKKILEFNIEVNKLY